MKTGFRKIASVRNFIGGTRWYLSDDCLLAAKRVWYSVEYQRFYLRDLQAVVIWSTNLWLWRMAICGVLFGVIGAACLHWANFYTGATFCGIGLALVLLDLAFGPTAGTRIHATGVSVELRLANRTRRARKVLANIDAAIRATRGNIEQPTAPTVISQAVEPSSLVRSEESMTASITAAPQTNGS